MKSSGGHLPMAGDPYLVSSNLRFPTALLLIAAVEAGALERLFVRSGALRDSRWAELTKSQLSASMPGTASVRWSWHASRDQPRYAKHAFRGHCPGQRWA